MNDTRKDVELRFRGMLMERSPAERLFMGCSMFDAVKAIVVSSLLDQYRGITPEEMRRLLFLRLYGREFDASKRARIAEALRAKCR